MSTIKSKSPRKIVKKTAAPKTRSTAARDRRRKENSVNEDVEAVLIELRGISNKKIRDEMGPRYGVHTEKAMGVGMAAMQKVAKEFKVNARPVKRRIQ